MRTSDAKHENRRKIQRPLSLRLTITALLISFAIGTVSSFFLAYYNYRNELIAAKDVFTQIESSYLPNLSDRLWEVNPEGVGTLLDSIAQLPNIGRVALTDESGHVFTRNADTDTGFSRRTFTLQHNEKNTSIPLGSISIELSNRNIYSQTVASAQNIALSVILMLTINSALILVLTRVQIIRHLKAMAKFADNLDTRVLNSELRLDRRPSNRYDDELDSVVRSLNAMQLRLRKELDRRTAVEKELHDHKSNLEKLVAERTLELDSSLAQLKIAASMAQIGIWSINLLNGSLEWNDRMYEMFGFSPDEISPADVYRQWSSLLHPDDAMSIRNSITRIQKSDEVYDTTFRCITPRSETRYIHMRAKSIRDNNGRLVKAIGVNYDVTTGIELQNQLRRAKNEADSASTAKSEFLANMSHELRTPMNAILGMLQLVERTKLDTRQRDYVVKARDAARALLDIVNDILDFSKIESKKLELDIRPFKTEDLWQDLGSILSGLQGDKPVEIIYDLPPGLPATLVGDAARIRQILINLAGNALKFTERGHVVVAVKTLLKGDFTIALEFSVIDTGIGISPEQIQSIFQSFKQGDATINRRFGGTGLGLSISHHLVAMMKGSLSVESELGKGSRFWFDLELPYQADGEAPSRYEPQPNPPRILIADTHPMTCETLARSIQFFGWQADIVNDTNQCVSAISSAANPRNAYQIVLLDGQFATRDNNRIIELIAESQRPKPSVIMIATAHDQEKLISALGMSSDLLSNVLLKPITPTQLHAAVAGALTGASINAATSNLDSTLRLTAMHSSHHRLEGLMVLVVDDNAFNRQVAEDLLRHEGAEVRLASGGQQAIDTVCQAAQPFDAVIMDMQMPGIDGLEATRRIRANERFRDLPILAMTANVSANDRAACLAANMNDHIGKPLDIEELVTVLLRLTGCSTLSPETQKESENEDTTPSPLIESHARVLARLGHSQQLFEKLLSRFSVAATIQISSLQNAFEKSSIPEASDVLHALKGNAANLGALALTQMAAEWELKLKNDPAMVLTASERTLLIERFHDLLRRSVDALSGYILAPAANAMETETTDIATFNLRQYLEPLLPLLETNNMQAVELIEALPAQTSGIDSQWLEELRNLVTNLDFDQAAIALRRWLG